MNPSVCRHEGKDHIFKGFLQAGGAVDFRCLTHDYFAGPNAAEIPDSGAAKMSQASGIAIARVQIRPSRGGDVDSK
jgi:hypothetical protein